MQLLYSAKELCEALSIGKTTLYKKIKTGEFPSPLKDGKMSRWTKEDLEGYISGLKRTSRFDNVP